MAMENTYAVILAGGGGERFWPLSTRARPKQFLSVFGGKPLLSLAVERLAGAVPPERTFIITAERLAGDTAAAAPGIPRENIVGEPCRRDTAAAVATACGMILRRDPEGVACVLTADHLMGDVPLFLRTLEDAAGAARANDAIVTIGILPDRPATGYGYIETGEEVETGAATRFCRALRFVEKPDAETAARYVASGRFLWNSGMFIWRASVMRGAFARHAPDLGRLCDRAAAAEGPDALRALLAEAYPALRPISIDYAVMERAENILTARGAFGWDDVGSWPAMAKHFPADAAGNVVVGACEALDAGDNIVVSPGRLTALIGVSGLVVVQAGGATLICPRGRAQEVKKLLRRIEARPDGENYV